MLGNGLQSLQVISFLSEIVWRIRMESGDIALHGEPSDVINKKDV